MKDKIKAFLFHIAISLLIAVISMSVVYGVWNPSPLHKATGVTHIFLVILAVDIVLGPLLTFIVYKKGKKTLKFDLVVIALLQLGALCYGMYKVYEGRPAWIVYNVDRFDLVRANEIDTRQLQKAKSEYQTVGFLGAKYVAAVIPDDRDIQQQLLFEEIGTGIAPSQRPELYQPIETIYPLIQKRHQPIENLKKYNDKQLVEQMLTQYKSVVGFLPLKANAVDMTVLVDKDGNVVKIVDLRPW